jgi:hypothetical protein
MGPSSNDPPKQARGISLPGQPTEEAVAEVGSEAGKSLVRGLARLGHATIDKWVVTKEAEAQAARLAIETDAQVARDKALTAARRDTELGEIDHQAALQRRFSRLKRELEWEQLNLEAIQAKAIEFTEEDPENNKPREIDEDWLFKFADLAQRVSDKEIRSLWSRVLSSAAIEGAPKLSAVALQTVSLLDKRSAEDLRKFIAVLAHVGVYATPPRGSASLHREPQSIDLSNLHDLGLIREDLREGPISVFDFQIGAGRTRNLGLKLIYSHQVLTKRGFEIVNAVFRNQTFSLDEETEEKYLQNLLEGYFRTQGMLTINFDGPAGQHNIVLTTKENVVSEDWKTSTVFPQLPQRMQRLLQWASDIWSIEIL